MEKKQWKQSKGLVIIYVGDGKGKTTAAMGAAVRALGHGWKVYVAQFMKEEKWPSGERDFFRQVAAPFAPCPLAHSRPASAGLRGVLAALLRRIGGDHAKAAEQSAHGHAATAPRADARVTPCASQHDTSTLGEIVIEVVGEGFVGIMGDRKSKETHKAAAHAGYEKARSIVKSGEYALVILDEILSAVDEGLLTEQQILDLIAAKPEDVTLLMTGHKHYPAIFAKADLVTEMKKLKHPFDAGFIAKQGIDY